MNLNWKWGIAVNHFSKWHSLNSSLYIVKQRWSVIEMKLIKRYLRRQFHLLRQLNKESFNSSSFMAIENKGE